MIPVVPASTLKASPCHSKNESKQRVKKKLEELLKNLNALPISMQESASTLLRQAAQDLQKHLDAYEDIPSYLFQEEIFSGLSALGRLSQEICDASGSAQDRRACWSESCSRFLSSMDPFSRLSEAFLSEDCPTVVGQDARQAAEQALSTMTAVKGVAQGHVKTLSAGRERSRDRALLDKVGGPVDDIRGITERHCDAFLGGVKDALLPLIIHPVDAWLLHPTATALLGTAQKLLPSPLFSGIGPGEKPSAKPLPWKAEDVTRECGVLLTNAALFWAIPKGISAYQNRFPVLLRSPDGHLQVREVHTQHAAKIEKIARSWNDRSMALLSTLLSWPNQLSTFSPHTLRSLRAIRMLSEDTMVMARLSKSFPQDSNYYWFTVSNKKGDPLGLIYVHCSPGARLEIESLVTNPDNFLNNTKGSGTLLFEMAETLAVERGNGTIEAVACSSALPFYKAKGCTIDSRYNGKEIIGYSISKTISNLREIT